MAWRAYKVSIQQLAHKTFPLNEAMSTRCIKMDLFSKLVSLAVLLSTSKWTNQKMKRPMCHACNDDEAATTNIVSRDRCWPLLAPN